MLNETKPGPAAKVDPDLLTIGDKTVARGQRVKFDLPVVQFYTHTDLPIPIEIIRGKRPLAPVPKAWLTTRQKC